MKDIINILELQTSDYLQLVFESYMQWCELYSLNARDYQKLLINDRLYTWYMRTYRSLELEFYKQVNTPDIYHFSTKELNKIYDNTTMSIGGYYPKSILRNLRKQTPKVKSKTIFNLN